jgi:hypothetical protein
VIGFDGEVYKFSFENGVKLGKIKGKFVERRYGREETEKKSQKTKTKKKTGERKGNSLNLV